ncbi:ABC transporter ATP-binding protein [Hoeflea sp. TYP-13]|uniref:ABC transporter ATP-binding protein n=1 Tax=Hoeflea sp. TYP-13 TaxID=3230023 RepID=UPI0034C6AEF7
MSTILALEGLVKNFGSLRVTDDVSLELRRDECHALIGPNGAGKSTLINLVSGNLGVESGKVVLDGADISHYSMPQRAHAGLGRTFQITSIIPSFSVLENVALAAQAKAGSSLHFFGRAAEEQELNEKARSALTMLGLADRQDVRSADLSHGEHRLLELAMAIVGEPKALLLDEPMAGMGKGESETLTDTLLTLKKTMPMLLVEHDMEAVFKLADRISVLAYGRVVATGTPDEVRADEQARAAYLGSDTP